jgi:L-galactono-1,4-lactone dehydrogenase
VLIVFPSFLPLFQKFDCGGQQWVSEVCLPAGSLEAPTGADMEFMDEV